MFPFKNKSIVQARIGMREETTKDSWWKEWWIAGQNQQLSCQQETTKTADEILGWNTFSSGADFPTLNIIDKALVYAMHLQLPELVL